MTDVTLSGLQKMTRAELAERWERVFGHPAPSHTRIPLLLGALGWHLQMQQAQRPGRRAQQGSSVPALLRKTQVRPSGGSLTAGTRLVREWQGRVHEVCVVPNGFEYAGTVYRSLSAIARKITGTAWSGPLFFGLRR